MCAGFENVVLHLQTRSFENVPLTCNLFKSAFRNQSQKTILEFFYNIHILLEKIFQKHIIYKLHLTSM